jgi:hypothetical protein
MASASARYRSAAGYRPAARCSSPIVRGVTPVPHRSRAAREMSRATLYQLHGDRSAWRYTGTPMTGWQKLDANPAATGITAGTTRGARR